MISAFNASVGDAHVCLSRMGDARLQYESCASRPDGTFNALDDAYPYK